MLYYDHMTITGDPLHSRALAHSRAPLLTQPCSHCSHSRAPGEQWARLCVFTLHGCVQAARLCRGSPVTMQLCRPCNDIRICMFPGDIFMTVLLLRGGPDSCNICTKRVQSHSFHWTVVFVRAKYIWNVFQWWIRKIAFTVIEILMCGFV